MGLESSDHIEDEEQQPKTKIFVLPEFSRKDLDDLTVLVLTDGNNRARGLNQGYDDGGKNVVRIAEYLAQRGDVSTLLACIMSGDNAAKRSDDFFWKLYQAFAALGVRMDINGTLVKDDIKIGVKGNMEELKKRGGVAAQFVNMVNAVCRKTDHIKNPRLNLVLGINYDDDIAIEEDVDIIFRSGMEVPNTVRLSGMRTFKGIRNFGSRTLWPHVTPEEIGSIVDEHKKEAEPVLHAGYRPEAILAMTPLIFPGNARNTEIHIPFTGSTEAAQKTFSDFFRSGQETTAGTIKIKNKTGETAAFHGSNDKGNSIHLVPATTVMFGPGDRMDYDCIIAPGQHDARFILGERPELLHATIFGAETTPESIANAVQEAVIFCMLQERLQGAERKSSGEHRFEDYLREVARYEKLSEEFKTANIAELKARLAPFERGEARGDLETFTKIKEKFVAFMLAWGKKKGLPINNEPQFRAFVNYAVTSLFMTCFPQYLQWEDHKENGAERAFGLARYMELVYMTDEYIYDYETDDPEKKKKLMTVATRVLCDAVNGEKIDQDTVPTDLPNRALLIRLAAEFSNMAAEFKRHNKNRRLVKEWTASMQNLFRSFAKEWSEELTSTEEPQDKETIDRLLRKAPPFLKKKIVIAQKKLASDKKEDVLEGETDIRLSRYFMGIEDSIGAGIAFRTIACIADPTDIDAETLAVYQELCFLMNIFYRIANDISGHLSRAYNDRENKTDCCTIIASKHIKNGATEEEALIRSVVELKTLLDEIKLIMEQKKQTLMTNWPLLGIAFIHAAIAELIYGKGHYRTTLASQMDEYIRELYYSAILQNT